MNALIQRSVLSSLVKWVALFYFKNEVFGEIEFLLFQVV